MTGIQSLGSLAVGAPSLDAIGRAGESAERASDAPKPAGFGDALSNAISSLLESQRAADSAAMEFTAGRTDDVASTMLAIHKADLSQQLALEVRNRIVDAYREILRMTV